MNHGCEEGGIAIQEARTARQQQPTTSRHARDLELRRLTRSSLRNVLRGPGVCGCVATGSPMDLSHKITSVIRSTTPACSRHGSSRVLFSFLQMIYPVEHPESLACPGRKATEEGENDVDESSPRLPRHRRLLHRHPQPHLPPSQPRHLAARNCRRSGAPDRNDENPEGPRDRRGPNGTFITLGRSLFPLCL